MQTKKVLCIELWAQLCKKVENIEDLKKKLNEEKETLEIRNKSLKGQIDNLNNQISEMQNKLTPVVQEVYRRTKIKMLLNDNSRKLFEKKLLLLIHHHADVDAVASAIAAKTVFKDAVICAPDRVSSHGQKIAEFNEAEILMGLGGMGEGPWLF